MPGPRAKAEPHPRIIAADTLALENVTYDEYYVAQNPGVKPGRYVLVRITDTGSGIAAQVLPKIFDPWFTTKRAGQGTGLGLSTIKGIVTTHYGG